MPRTDDAVDIFPVGDVHPPVDLLIRDMEQLYGFRYAVAQMPVELLLYGYDPFPVSSPENHLKVVPHGLAAVPYHMVYEEICNVAERIKHFQREMSQSRKKVYQYPVFYHLSIFLNSIPQIYKRISARLLRAAGKLAKKRLLE